MRNLKRALSLALASVMLLGMMVVGTSASYTDVTSKNNQEAIEVLQKVGIMTGDDKGNFNPDQKVTRNEMAVIMCNLLDYTVASYKGTSKFTDVPAWAEPYVAACYTNGIIAGYSATTFGGNDSVTTGQAALMLLKALGYFQYASDFGDDWLVATTSQGAKVSLFDDVDTGAREALTRNDVAQMVLNALKADVVDYTGNGGTTVKGDGFEITTGKATYAARTSTSSKYGAIANERSMGSTKYTVQLGEDLYSGDLKMSANVTDDFGRPATKWSYKTNVIGTYGDAPILTSTAKVTIGSLYSLIGSSNVDDLTLKTTALVASDKDQLVVYQDGTQVTSGTVATYFDRNSSNGAQSGKGVLTEVYQDGDNNVTIVYVDTYVAQATDDYSSSKGEVKVTVMTKPTAGFTNFNTLSDDDFDAVKNIKEDDYILYTYANGKVQDIVKAEVVTGKVTAYSTSTGKTFGDAGGSVTLDGTKYNYAKFAEVDATNGCAVVYTVNVDASIVVDANGYAYYVDEATASTGNYLYVDGMAKASGLSDTIVADAYFADGTNAEITVKKIDGANAETVITTTTRDTTKNEWYKYSKDSNGKYTLTKATTSAKVAAGSVTIKTNKTALGGGFAANKNTVFIVKDKNDNIKVYTGIANVPDLTVIGGYAQIMRDKDTAGKAASLVFVDVGTGSVKNSSKDSLIYLLKLDNTSVDNEDNQDVYTWKVIMDGKETTIQTKESGWAAKTLLEDYTTDSDGYYEKGNAFDTPDSDKFEDTLTKGAISQSGDILTVTTDVTPTSTRTMVVNSDTKINLILMPSEAKTDTSSKLRREIMSDWSADYELTLGTTAKNLANILKGYQVTGTVYVTYDDAAKSDVVTNVYVVVTSTNP